MVTTSRLGLDVPQGTDSVSGYPTQAAQALDILDNTVTITQGTLVSRPAAGSVPVNTMYYATDVGLYYITNGTTWVQVLEYGFGPTAFRTASSSLTANPGDWLYASPSVTITLPDPHLTAYTNAIIAITANPSVTGSTPVTITATGSGSQVRGVGNSSTSIVMGIPNSTILLQGLSSAWQIISGQQDTGWVALGLTGGVAGIAANYWTPAARLIGNIVYLRGAFQAATTISGGTGIFSFSSTFSPGVADVGLTMANQTSGAAVPLLISSGVLGGKMGTGGGVTTGNVVSLDGLTYALS
jgi:hypothetical protein